MTAVPTAPTLRPGQALSASKHHSPVHSPVLSPVHSLPASLGFPVADPQPPVVVIVVDHVWPAFPAQTNVVHRSRSVTLSSPLLSSPSLLASSPLPPSHRMPMCELHAACTSSSLLHGSKPANLPTRLPRLMTCLRIPPTPWHAFHCAARSSPGFLLDKRHIRS
ncbi:hypothetical protein PMIN01_11112 [Paraphaeosphaeria minitans]|uniref:Uncharacterized protein n=1 Tax=Paraphaeosphaeria minitans TaxID=565426 RepID=A0A9P6KL49_9PLEO|nr:hypothetical protein PMIN01_11112 [Paraphaeosphaeria minitans]